MLKIVQTVINTPLTWYASRFNLSRGQVRFSVWFILTGSLVINLILAALALLGLLPR